MPKGTIIFPKIGGAISTNKKRKLSRDSAYDNNVMGIKALKNLNTDYLFWVMQKIDLNDWASASALPSMKASTVKEHQIPVPPLAEQERIVAKLDALFSRIDQAIAQLQHTQAQTKALFASALDAFFTQVSEKYPTKKLKQVTSKIGSGSTPRGGGKSYKAEGIPLIRSLNVYDNKFRKKGLAFIDDEQASRLNNVIVQHEDVLLNITGASVARCCIAPKKFLPARVNQHVSIIRPTESVSSIFLVYYLISPKIKNALLFQGAGGATRQALTKTMIQDFEVPVPPLAEQSKIVAQLDAISERTQALTAATSAQLEKLQSLKASLLDAAFRGQL